MNNIVFSLFCLLCLLITPDSSFAVADITDVCKEFTSVLEKPDANESQINHSRFKKGLLWKIESSTGKTNHLFGTMHTQDYAASTIQGKVRLALVKSKVLLMETIPNEEANQAFLEEMYFKDEQRLNALLEPELLEVLTAKLQDYGVAEEYANLVKPWAAFSLIGRPKPVRAPTLESNLLQIAQQSRLQIKSLETMTEILSALDGLTMEDQVIILKDTICNHDKIVRSAKILLDLYINRDLAGIAEFNNQAHYDEAVFERFMQRILYDRNIRMLERIEKEFTNGNVFVAVGASHLIDKKGLLSELEKRGYTLTPVY